MKKQILLLTMFVAAMVVGTSSAFGQAINNTNTRGIDAVGCADDAEHPIAGRTYDYTAQSNQDGTFTYWATKNTEFITTAAGPVTTTNIGTMLLSPTTGTVGTDLAFTSADYGAAAANTANTDETVQIAWSDAILAGTDPTLADGTPTFVVAWGAGTCTDNLKVWSIDPINAFVVDILNINEADGTVLAYDADEEQCFDVVRNATYNSTSSSVEYDFGTQVLSYEVIAANFTTSWTPTFNLSGLNAAQTATIEWAYEAAFTTIIAGPTAIVNGTPVTTAAAATALVDTQDGVSIFVRVTITNTTFEGLADTPITLAVDGVNANGDFDIENNTLALVGPLCNPGTVDDQADQAVQNLLARPTITPVNPAAFVAGDNSN